MIAIFFPSYKTLNKGHGRIEIREFQVSKALKDYIRFPYVEQVLRIHRITTDLNGENRREEVVHSITSVAPELGSIELLAGLSRGHWVIENSQHWVRDVTYDEDRSQVRTGSGPRVMASLRNCAISLLRLNGITSIAEGLRKCAWEPGLVLGMTGL